MAIKSILFNTDMVQAILRGQKTCTRRIVKGFIPDDAIWDYNAITPKGYISCRGTFPVGYGEKFFKLPYQRGDILYVRETWCKGSWMNEKERYYYKADDNDFPCAWYSSVHMPKEAARIWLKVTGVRVERLQDITEEGVIKEGAQGVRCDHVAIDEHGCTDCLNTEWVEPPIVDFMLTWDSTIKKSDIDRYSWQANPWVWVIEFERCEKPKEE